MREFLNVVVVSPLVFGCGVLEESDVVEGGNGIAPEVALPEGEYCERVVEWDARWTALEDEVLTLVNLEREAGGVCRSSTEQRSFEPAAPVVSNGALRCAARNHSLDMGANRFFSHSNPETAEEPADRVNRSGYVWSRVGENIAVGQGSAQEVVDSWMGSFGHCTNILEPRYEELGVGFFDSGQLHSTVGPTIPGLYWTQNFASPR